ncbi:ABC transporter substrate-binding protein [Arthrobacter sp. JSM 101049]|uniref:ABC transporter substrate-binding protein n=1 Tax=Arthrobacter sp. JSM 101049 TaxID=929097 RepID=UPI003561989F
MKNILKTTVAAIAVLGLAACGSGSPSGGADDAAASGGGQLTPVTVGVIPIVDTAPIWLGDEQGFFADEGLDLDIQTASGGAAIIPGIQSGSYDFAFSNLVSLMVANDKGLDMKIVANGNSTTGTDHDFGAVVVPGDSAIKSPKDLAGKKVSVNNLSNIGDTTIKNVVEEDGGDPDAINFVEVGFPDAPAALDNGVVDAAWILDPFLTQSVDDGARVISNNFTDFDPNLDIAAYFTSQESLDKNPELGEKFQRAMNKSLEFAQENPDKVRDIVGTYTKIDAETRKKLILPTFRVEMNREAAQKLGDAAVKYGTLQKAPDLDALLP